MYGGFSKLGRGRGGGRGGRGLRNCSSFPPPPPHRPSSTPPTGRLSLAPRNGPGFGGGLGPALAVEECFSLVSKNHPLAFAMIIRLAPDLVEEIRRLEAQGGTARIKFDSIPTNPSGNVIDVGGKEFRFTWSQEFGDLCDIYEECPSGEDRNDLLVESGCAWRKLNVQRILDESTTNHVKMRSEEAERKHKSRKAIILDHGNPSMKNQIKQLAAVEASPRKSNFKKEHAFKKLKAEMHQAAVGGPPKSGYKLALISTANAKGRSSSSPLPSPPERSGATASAVETGNITKSHTCIEDVMAPQLKSKENIYSSEKEISNKATNAACEMPGHRGNFGPKPMDLQSLLISQLKENPQGMSLKKAVGDTIPNSSQRIEPIVKKVATFQDPGRYILKPGVELESLKRPSSESGSSAEDNYHKTPAPDENHVQTPNPVPSLLEKITHEEMEEQTHLDSRIRVESNVLEQIDIQQQSPDLCGERKASKNSEGPANSASDSGSDSDSASDSDSSNSGSDSGSHSGIRSPVASGSSCSSDSESDASSNSEEGSDEDVDIITSNDDKETKQDLQTSELGLLTSPIPWSEHGRSLQNGVAKSQGADGSDAVDIEGDGSDAVDVEDHGSYAVDIEKDWAEDEQEIGMDANTNKEGEKPGEGTKPSSSDRYKVQERENFIGNLFDDTENIVRHSIRHEQSDNSERLHKAKSKRGSDLKHFDEESRCCKRLKSESMSQTPVSGSRGVNFFKQTGSRPSTSENFNPDLSRGKPVGKTNWDSGKSPSNLSGLKRTLKHHVEDLTRLHHKVSQSQQQYLSKLDHPEVVSQFNKVADTSKTSQNETVAKLGVGLDDCGEIPKKASSSAPQQPESEQGSVSKLTSNKMANVTDVRMDTVLTENNVSGQKKRGSSADEDSCPYFMYEKDEPECRGPIKDASQYEECITEFRKKYESYKDLDKALQTYRNDFKMLGKDLEYLKDRDKEKYYKTLEQLLQSYHQCGMRHKRLKKIFLVLHRELKNLKQRLVEYAQSHSIGR